MGSMKLEQTLGTNSKNLLPNESSIGLFRDLEANEIFWEDPNELIPNVVKESIEMLFTFEKGEMLSNSLFDFISKWHSPREARPFVKDLLFAISLNVAVDRRNHQNQTPIMIAAHFDAEKAVLQLIERGAKLEAVDKHGNTALHLGAANASDL